MKGFNARGRHPRLPLWAADPWSLYGWRLSPHWESLLSLTLRQGLKRPSKRKTFGQDGERNCWIPHPFGPMNPLPHKEGCCLWKARVEPAKLCVPGEDPSCLYLKVRPLCPDVHFNFLIMHNTWNVLFQIALEAGTDVRRPCMCYPAVSGGLC